MTPLNIQLLPSWPEATPTPGVDVRCLSEVQRRHAYARRWVEAQQRRKALARVGATLGNSMRALGLVSLGAGPTLVKIARLAEEAELAAEVEQMWDHETHAPAPPCVDPTSPF